MKKTVFLFLCILTIAGIASTYEKKGNLIIKVISNTGMVLPGARVEIISPNMTDKEERITNPFGWAVFRNIPEGTYKVEVSFLDEGEPKIISDVQIVSKKTKIIQKIINPGDFRVHECYHGTTPLVDTTLNTIEYQHYGELSDFLNYIDHQPIDKKYNAKNTLRPGNCIIKNDHGDILVVVLSDENEPVENASITIRSNSLMGIRSEYTGVDGRAAVLNLPPGIYVVETYKSGFNLLIDTDISIGEGRNAYLIEKLSINKDYKVYSRRCVEGLPPMIDVTRSSLVHEYDMNTVRHLP